MLRKLDRLSAKLEDALYLVAAVAIFGVMAFGVAQIVSRSVSNVLHELVPAMERGVIDAFEFNNPSSDMRFGSPDVAKNYILSSYHQASESFEFLFNRDWFDGLDDDIKAILQRSVHAAGSSVSYAS